MQYNSRLSSNCDSHAESGQALIDNEQNKPVPEAQVPSRRRDGLGTFRASSRSTSHY
jgi:hypothetical protein